MTEFRPESPESHESSFLLLGIRENVGDGSVEFVGTMGENAKAFSLSASRIKWEIDERVAVPVVEVKTFDTGIIGSTSSATVRGKFEDLNRFLVNLGFVTMSEAQADTTEQGEA